MERAMAAGVEAFYLPNIDSTSVEDMLQLEAAFPEKCHAMMGLHPCHVNENVAAELQVVETWLQQRSFAAIGEIGLDYYWDTTHATQQQQAFEKQIHWALEYDLPIVIHSRNSMADCIATVRRLQNGKLRGIFHCFGGTVEEAKQITDLGFLLGIGGVITYKKSGLAAVIQQIPLEHLVLETDAPYLTPVPHRGKRNEPAYLPYVCRAIAEAKNCSAETVAAATTTNARKLFGS
jgi:TatD DNase family protein